MAAPASGPTCALNRVQMAARPSYTKSGPTRALDRDTWLKLAAILQQGVDSPTLTPPMANPHSTRPVLMTASESPQLLENLKTLCDWGAWTEAEQVCRDILAGNPADPVANQTLGALLLNQDQHDEAIQCFRTLVEQAPADASNWWLYIDALLRGRQDALAAQTLQFACGKGLKGPLVDDLKLKLALAGGARKQLPDPILLAQMSAKQRSGDSHKTLSLYRLIIDRYPAYVQGWLGTARILAEQKLVQDAIVALRRGLHRLPSSKEIKLALTRLLAMTGKTEEQLPLLEELLEEWPADNDLRFSYADLLQALGRPRDALDQARQILSRDAEHTATRLLLASLAPVLAQSVDEIATFRKINAQALAELAENPPRLTQAHFRTLSTAFYLAYQNRDNRHSMETRCRILRQAAPQLTWRAPHLDKWQSPASDGRRIRIGFASRFLATHTIGKLYAGILENLDKTRFEVQVLHLPNPDSHPKDPLRAHLHQVVDKVIQLPETLSAQQQAIAAEKLDILFYPDIGMTPSSYYLAFARLAPVQLVSWGHPDTTGIDTIDYFLSAECLEPDNAASHYSEHLIQLPRLPCFYQRPAVSPLLYEKPRSELDLPESGRLYGCPQSLFKLHPDFDKVLADIAHQDPDSHFVLIEQAPAWRTLLMRRWQENCPAVAERACFLPRLSGVHFYVLLCQIDVLLDPLYFGSGNTLYEALAVGTPTVTCPGNFMRGRIVAGAYQQMGIDNPPVASSHAEYAQLAVTLAQDRPARDDLAERLRHAAEKEIFSYPLVVRAMEAFFEEAIEAAAHHTRLPENWCFVAPA